jgi:predicted DNA-binding transcriptional regulator AlpA
MHPSELPNLWDISQVANFLQTTKEWVYRNYKYLQIPYIRVGNQLRFIPAEIMQWVDGRKEIA